MSEIRITAEITPNPNTLKFVIDRHLFEFGSYDFPTQELAKHSPLATELYMVAGVDGVMIGINFVSVTKTDETDWSALAEPVTTTIRELLEKGTDINDEDYKVSQVPTEEETEIIKKIKTILDDEIRPAVAMDGGDIRFAGYKDGTLSLMLQGACSGCPSASMTLRMGIENRLKEDIPELEEVVQI